MLKGTLICALLVMCLLKEGAAWAQNGEGAFAISPVDAPDTVLEAVDAGTTDGTAVAIGAPSGEAKQKWNIVSKGDNVYAIKPSYSSTLVLAPKEGGKGNGTLVILETENDQPAQLWSIKENEKGAFAFIPRSAPGKALDNPGGGKKPGTMQDVWDYMARNSHLQWIIVPLDDAKMPFATAPAMTPPVNPAAISPPPAPEIPLANVPKGVIKMFTLDNSAIFPGTEREGAVFIPAQYDGSKPACVYVQQDGYNPKNQVKDELEQLIAAKEMPVTIAIFIKPGTVPPPMNSTMGRPIRRHKRQLRAVSH